MSRGLGSLALVLALVALPAWPGRAETLLERGSYLINSIVACGNCHTPQGPDGPLPGMELAGGLLIQDEAFTVHTPNITPDKETGIGKWTDDQIMTAIREAAGPMAGSSARRCRSACTGRCRIGTCGRWSPTCGR